MFASTAMAEEVTTAPALTVTGGIGVEFTEDTADNVTSESTVNFGANVEANGAFASFMLESVDGADPVLDAWKLGVNLGTATVSYGDQGDLFVGNDFEVVGGDTIANPTEFDSLMINSGDAALMIAFTDTTTDASEVESVQGSVSVNETLTLVGDYNIDSEEYILGGKASLDAGDFALGGLVTYESVDETIGYEASAGIGMVTAFVNGDDTDTTQNVGVGIHHNLNGLDIFAEGSYNLDSEEVTPAAGISFAF